jgi:hypothetical protein
MEPDKTGEAAAIVDVTTILLQALLTQTSQTPHPPLKNLVSGQTIFYEKTTILVLLIQSNHGIKS